MKKKVVIEKVPSSKKKVVIEGLPKADPGMLVGANQTNETDENTGNYYQGAPDVSEYGKRRMEAFLAQNPDLLETTDEYGNKIKTGDRESFMQKVEGQVPFKTGIYEIAPSKQIQQKQKKIRKPSNVNYKMDIPKFYPLVGNKYLQQAVMDFNDAATYASNIGRQPKDVTLPPATYNPYVNMYYGENGGYLPVYQPGGQWGQFTNNLETPYYTTPPANLQQEPIIRMTGETNNELAPLQTEGLQEIQLGQNTTSTTQGSNPWVTAGSIMGTVSKLGSGVAHGIKGGLDIAGTNLANKRVQALENQLYTQSVFNDAMQVTPQDYIYNRNALAENGKQIKEIGGKGMPNVEVEDSEFIQMPDGFSQSIYGATHAEGGIPLNLPMGSKIFSDKLKIKTENGKKKSYADLAKKYETKKNIDVLESKFSDGIQKSTADMMIKIKNQKLDNLFEIQETNKKSGLHGKEVQVNALQEDTQTAADGKYITVEGKRVYATKVKEPGKEYKAVPNMPGYFYKETETRIPGTAGTPGIPAQKITKFMTNEQWKDYLKKETPEQRERRHKREQGTPAIAGTPETIKKAEDYVYIEPEQKDITPITPQIVKKTYEVPGMDLGIGLPNAYERLPLNYYKIEPQYIDPRYLDIQPQLNRIGRAQRALETTLGSRGASDMANLLQAQANRAAAEQEAFGTKYNYDRAQDAAAQQFNAQAKTQADQYNQQSWFNQLEDPIRRRESIIGTQKAMDAQAAIENARWMQAFYGNKDFIGKTFYPAQGMTSQDWLSELPMYSSAYQKGIEEGKKTKAKKYGGKVKVKMKLRK